MEDSSSDGQSATGSVPGAVRTESSPPPETAPSRTLGFERWISRRPVEIGLLVLVSAFSVFVTFSVLLTSVDLYFTVDGGHYAADADALMGHGVRDIRHPLLFPAMLAILQPFGGDVAAFQAAMGVTVFLLPVALYFLLRQWLPPIPSLVGAALGPLTPPIGELLGWGGGATLIGLDFMILSIAAMERWMSLRGRQGLLVGLFVGLTALSHPFVLGATGVVLLVRWVFDAASRRSFTHDWGPLSLRGIASTLAIAAGLLLLSANYYLRLTAASEGGLLNAGLPWNLLLWSVRENVFLLFFFFLGILLPLPLGKPTLMVVVVAIAALFLAIPVFAPWDVSYSSRVVYFLPIVFGAGAGLLAHLILEQVKSFHALRKLEVPVVIALLLAAPIGAAYGLGYAQRLEVASAYYQRIHASDLAAFDYLRQGTGAVATSWMGAFQDQGSVNAWLVQGLSKRPAFGPGAPWLSTIAEEAVGDTDMQRLFAGSVGVENGDLQIAATRTGGLRDPALQVSVGGFYYPLLYLNSFANRYPFDVQEGVNATSAGATLTVHHPAVQGGGELVEQSTLDSNGLNVTFTLSGGNVSTGPWDVWIWPAYYRPWDSVLTAATGIETTQSYRTGAITTRISTITAGSSVSYYPTDPRWGIQGIDVVSNGTSLLEIRITVEGGDPVGTPQSFDEANLLAGYGVTDVLLWKDTGWQARFDVSSRFIRSFETDDLIVYSVVP